MIKILIIRENKSKDKIAILEDNRLIEYYKVINYQIYIGNIYIAKIIYIYKGMNSIFLDIGYYKYGFLNYNDIGNYFLSLKKKKIIYNKIKGNNVNVNFKLGQYIIVQVIKNILYNKGPKLTCKIKLVGLYIILLPYDINIYISKKIKKKILYNIYIPKGFGIVFRTNSLNISIKKIKFEIFFLLKLWYSIFYKIKKKRIIKLYNNNNYLYNILKNKINKYSLIISNNLKICKRLSYYYYIFGNVRKNIQYYNSSSLSLLRKYNIYKQKKILFNKYIYLNNCTNLIIENTETLNLIDINSNMLNESNALKSNKIALYEIVRQIILRNMGGLIIIDLIDIRDNKNIEILYKYIKKKMKIDRVKHKILPPSRFNLIEIAREQNYNIINIKNKPKNIYINIYVKKNIKKIEKYFNFIFLIKKIKYNICLYVNPILYTYLKYGIYSYIYKWYIKYHKYVCVSYLYNLNILEYKIKKKYY